MLRSSWSDNEGREWCSLEDFFDMCLRTTFDKTRVRKCVATTRTSNTTKNLWRGECRNREQPCFYLFFDQRPRNYVIVVIWSIFYTITLFSFILHIFAMKTFNKHSTNKGRREDEMIIIWILKPWHYFAYYLNAYYLVCDKRYLFFNFFFFFFWKKSPRKIYWNRAYSLSAIRLKINISMLVAISWRENFFFCFGWSSWNWFGSYVMIRQKFEILDFYVAHICNSICEVTLLNFA